MSNMGSRKTRAKWQKISFIFDKRRVLNSPGRKKELGKKILIKKTGGNDETGIV